MNAILDKVGLIHLQSVLDTLFMKKSDCLSNEEIDDIFVGSFKIVDGYLVGDGTFENGILTTNMKVEDGYVII